jgi:hypothetical protein
MSDENSNPDAGEFEELTPEERMALLRKLVEELTPEERRVLKDMLND